jgi:tRNA G18 (ribose-2'-O)-methylase SpoU
VPRVSITADDDPRLADYRAVREADRVGRAGIFLVESVGVVRVFLASKRWRVRSLFLSERRVDSLSPEIAALVDRVPVFVAPQEVMERVVGFDIHRGVLASGDRGAERSMDEVLGDGPRLVVACEGVSNHDNIGGIFRNAAAFGADAVLLDRASCDPLYRKAIRVSSAASLLVPFARSTDLVSELRARGFQVIALTPSADAIDLDAVTFAPRTALLFGAEGPGLSDRSLGEAHVRARIPIAKGFDSLNVATTSGIALHVARRALGARP